MRDVDAVIHLGAIVGDPACALDEELTIEVNLMATRMIAEVAKGSGVQSFHLCQHVLGLRCQRCTPGRALGAQSCVALCAQQDRLRARLAEPGRSGFFAGHLALWDDLWPLRPHAF